MASFTAQRALAASEAMPQPLPQEPARSPSSLSNTTYYSCFDDIDPQPTITKAAPATLVQRGIHSSTKIYDPDNISIASAEMHRQDSGYESISPRDPPSTTTSRGPRSSRQKNIAPTSSLPGNRARASARRPATSGPVAGTRAPKPKPRLGDRRSLFLTQSNPVSVRPTSYYGYADSTSSSPYSPHANAQSSYFHFPAPDPQLHDYGGHRRSLANDHVYGVSAPHPSGSMPPKPAAPSADYDAPPQTTHYWTSDHTRRLEYAAIDAASRGVRGWLMRHMVPDCFVPKAKRRVAFDDDTGSVRRYRLELDESEDATTRGNRTNRNAQKNRVSTF